jgi:hypothetical protein
MCRLEDNIKMDLVVCEDVDSIFVARDRYVVADLCEYGNEPWISIKGGEFTDHLSDCRLMKDDCASLSQIN